MQARVTIPNDGTRGQRRAHTSGMRSLHTVADQLNPCGLGRCVAGATRHRKMGPLCRDCLVCRRGSLYEWLCGVNAHRPRSPCMPMRLARGPILTRSRTERTHDAPGRLRLCCIITIADTVNHPGERIETESPTAGGEYGPRYLRLESRPYMMYPNHPPTGAGFLHDEGRFAHSRDVPAPG